MKSISRHLALLLLITGGATAIEVTVSPVGPIKTLVQARDEVRKARAQAPEERATIVVKAGTYFASQPLVLEKSDSNLVLMAEPGAAPQVVGAVVVTGWEKHQGKIIKADASKLVPKGSNPRQLFCDGERQILARYPNFDPKDPLYGGWAFVEEFPATGAPAGHDWNKNLYVKKTDIRKWAHPEDVELDIFAQYGWWNFIESVESLDLATGKLTLKKSLQL